MRAQFYGPATGSGRARAARKNTGLFLARPEPDPARRMPRSRLFIIPKKRKRQAPRERIRYGPIDERDRIRLEYLENKIWKNDVTCVDMLRLSKASFFHFCKLFRDRGLLQDTIHMCVEQQVAMFWDTVGHYTYVVLFFISMYC